jgi:hypothetical protein
MRRTLLLIAAVIVVVGAMVVALWAATRAAGDGTSSSGWYLYADFGSGRAWRMNGPAGRPARISLGRQVPSLASFGEGLGGELYVVSLAGAVYRIVARLHSQATAAG